MEISSSYSAQVTVLEIQGHSPVALSEEDTTEEYYSLEGNHTSFFFSARSTYDFNFTK